MDWVGLEPVIVYTVAVSLPAQPPHPNAAKLFIEWLLSKEGQEVINQYGRVPIRDDIESKYRQDPQATRKRTPDDERDIQREGSRNQ